MAQYHTRDNSNFSYLLSNLCSYFPQMTYLVLEFGSNQGASIAFCSCVFKILLNVEKSPFCSV